MAAHGVNVSAAQLVVGKRDVEFSIYEDGNRFGRLEVSQGAIVWRPRNKKKGYRLTWRQLDRLANEWGKRGWFPI